MNYREELITKYNHYLTQDHLVLTVTMSTRLYSEAIAYSDVMRQFWDREFLYRVKRNIPSSATLDHDFVVESSRAGMWHYHGLLATRRCNAHALWKDGKLNRRISRDVAALRHDRPQYRQFVITSFLIEPVNSVEAWCRYITKSKATVFH